MSDENCYVRKDCGAIGAVKVGYQGENAEGECLDWRRATKHWRYFRVLIKVAVLCTLESISLNESFCLGTTFTNLFNIQSSENPEHVLRLHSWRKKVSARGFPSAPQKRTCACGNWDSVWSSQNNWNRLQSFHQQPNKNGDFYFRYNKWRNERAKFVLLAATAKPRW